MAVVLRLARFGKHKSPSYRIVATDKQSRRDGRFLEIVGTYNPLRNPAAVTLKEDLIRKWIAVGALPSEVVRRLIIKQIPGLVEAREENQLKKIRAARAKRKAKSAGAPKKDAAPKAAAPKKTPAKKAAAKKAE